jgi:hypothetical protein
MNLKTNLNVLLAAVALVGVAAAPTTANAQSRRAYQTNRWNVSDLINRAERTSNAFREAVERRDERQDRRDNDRDRDWNRNRGRFFDELEPNVRRMDEAFERLRRVARNDRRDEGRREMQDVLQYARAVDRYFVGNQFGWGNGNGNRNRNRYNYTRSGTLNSRWRDLRNDINSLARLYRLPALNGRR